MSRKTEEEEWIENDEWLFTYHKDMTPDEISEYIYVRRRGIMSQPTLDRPWRATKKGQT